MTNLPTLDVCGYNKKLSIITDPYVVLLLIIYVTNVVHQW